MHMGDIFQRQWLTPSQLRLVADRRFDDANYLRSSGLNARANGVFYLAGFVVECLLKARLAEQYPTVASQRNPAHLSKSDRDIWEMIFRSHELNDMLERLPDIRKKMEAARTQGGAESMANLNRICGAWTIFARYSTRSETMKNASHFLDSVKELTPWLR
jgi:hypothetical protein